MEYKIIKLNTARNALRYIIKAFQIKELYMPYYLCPAMRISVLKENCRIKFYHIDTNFEPVEEFPIEAYILYPDYFGICGSITDKLSFKYKNLIVDNAHSFYSKPKGTACFNSIRKFFPKLKDGSFLYTTKTIDINIEKNNYFYKYEKLSYKDICLNENRLDNEDIKYISDCTNEYYSKLDLLKEKQRYLNSFYFYHNKLVSINRLNLCLKEGAVPFKYPYLAENKDIADEFAKQCEEHNITVFRYWNNMPDSYNEKTFYECLIAV